MNKKENIVENEIKKLESSLLKKADVESARTEIIVQKVLFSLKPYRRTPKVVNITKHDKRLIEEEDVLMLGDFHIGDFFTYEETNGISEYNLNIFKNRIEKLKKEIKRIRIVHAPFQKNNVLHLIFLGDIVQGDDNIGAWGESSMPIHVMKQTLESFDIISDMIYFLLSLYDQINFYGIRGNHGRTTKETRNNNENNWDTLCYKFIEKKFINEKRIKFNIPKSWFITPDILSNKVLITHGDDVASSENNLNKIDSYYKNIIDLLDYKIDLICTGHFHTAHYSQINKVELLCNGSIVGGNVYSIKDLHKNNIPMQKIFGIKKKGGSTWQYNIKL